MTRIFMTCMLIAFSLSVAAQFDSSYSLDEVVVTANRFTQKQINTGKVITVIKRKEIENSPFVSIGELLGRQAGITIIGSNNSPGANNDVYMRGAGTGNLLILIDGLPAYDVSSIRETFDINFIPLGEIERIEILKGGQSTLYGSDAVAGVVNIITRNSETKKPSAQLHLQNGSYNSNSLDLSSSGKVGALKYKMQYMRSTSDGFSSAIDSTKRGGFDKDGFKQNFLMAQLGSASDEKWGWRTNVQWNRYTNDVDQTGYEDAKDFTAANENLVLSGGITRRFTKATIHANISMNNSIRNYFDDSVSLNGFTKFFRNDYTGRSVIAEVYGNYRFNENFRFFAGFDQRWLNTDQYFLSVSDFGNYESNLNSDSAKIRLSSFTSSLVYNSKKGINIELGGRLNLHSRYGENATFTFNPSYVLNEKWKFAYNLSSAFKAPTLYQLYDGVAGVPTLKPETSITSEISVEFIGSKHITAQATLFQRKIKNGIDYDYSTYKYFNYGEQSARGIEMEIGYRNDNWHFNVNYTLMKSEVNTAKFAYDAGFMSYFVVGDTTYSQLFRVPASSLNASASWQANKKLHLSIFQRVAGKRYEPIFDSAPVELKPYATTDLFGEYQIGKRIRVYSALKNMWNAQYQEVLGFATRGRNYLVGLRLKLN
jgi:vitamin B12 transporter